MDFSSISRRNRTVGRILRLPLDLIPKDAVVPVMQGVLKGKRWIVGASLHACWLGSYEMQKQHIVADALKPGDVFYDIGANVGFYALIAAQAVGAAGHVYTFEPFPRNIPYIQKHVALNQLTNVTIFEMAIADKEGVAHFQEGLRHTNGRIDDSGTLEVRVASLDGLIAHEGLRLPTVLKIDVEGGELAVLQGARKLLTEHKPLIFLATHSPDLHTSCATLLKEFGYQLEEFPSVDQGGELIARRG